MPAIASLEDLKAAQKDLCSKCLTVSPYDLGFTPYDQGFTLCAMRFAVWKWRRIGWENICKLWLEESTPEQLKGESD